MKVSRLYIKIFIAFVAVLMVSESIVIWVVHSGLTGNPHANRIATTLNTVKILSIDTMKPSPAEMQRMSDTELPKVLDINSSKLEHLLRLLATSFKSEIWITDRDGKVVASSFRGSPPETSRLLQKDPLWVKDNILIYKEREDGMKFTYSILPPLPLDRNQFTYHTFSKRSQFEDEAWFLRGQVLLTLLAALFLIPVSRRIIRPMKKLTSIASRYGEGDFSQRVKVKGRDEVAALAASFNDMADNLEKLLKGGKELTAHMSHEIRSPLTRMRISLEMLKEKYKRGDIFSSDKYIHDMEEEIDRMDFLVEKILQFSKMDMRTKPPMEDRVNIANLILTAIERYKTTAERSGLKIKPELDEIILEKCNVYAIRTLLDNLLDNAFKYTEKNGTISVKLADHHDKAYIEVTNTHQPIPESELSKLFNPFHRLKGEDTPGSGLGLPTAKKIVEIHGGKLSAHNTKEGFTIKMELPLK
ncbi:HAMP domain-containing sensor histidine kinase [Maridesulfovibrio bastinii]|uniref:HAMP domain-containing sensor histidine kinase n=1 Tax=Maridesulfovibrio bastinii TaxID=47157 RepID=UPI0004148751|nr:HAMP domain-containing sensor histidine kinase [Maridesulfovibrio bastinii]